MVCDRAMVADLALGRISTDSGDTLTMSWHWSGAISSNHALAVEAALDLPM
jgi:hypothetical protein